MSRRLISSWSTFERDIGYSRAVVDGEWIFVSGTTGFDYAVDDAFRTMWWSRREESLRNISGGARRGRAGRSRDVVRVHYILGRPPVIFRAAGRRFASISAMCGRRQR